MTKKARRLSLSAVVGLVLGITCWSAITIYAGKDYRRAAVLSGGNKRHVDWVLVIGRRPEKTSSSDKKHPHRNSPLALYEISNDELVKREGDLISRSTSTAQEMPELPDLTTVSNYLTRHGGSYPFGFVSVPEGLYILQPMPWKKTGTTGLRLSSIQNSEGYINLQQEQIIQNIKVAENNDGDRYIIDGSSPERKTKYKSGVFLHPSPTRYWSHLDSQGCINLLASREGEDDRVPADFDVLLNWLGSRGLLESEAELMLLLVDYEELNDANDDELPSVISPSLLLQHAKGVELKW